ncbi:Thioredoxin-like superfamily [Arabidopsis suecica]|uniref:glutaredoxin-dependent peroxiredoxin n=1 Tax=Arabidopsis suecica TaxID=45249 RepID=A0A8T2HGP6_ARASU|nr:Thioredoxin-like superfamily [Arabidopsis suecica]
MAPIDVGDFVPDGSISFFGDDDQLQTVSVHSLAAGKKVILFGVPGAFPPTCSMKYVNGFIEKAEELKSNGVDEIICFSGNYPFMIKACPENKHVKFVADGSGEYIQLLGLELDVKDKGLGVRSRGFALLLDNLKVIVVNVGSRGDCSLFQLMKMTTTTMSNLPTDLLEEIISRVPRKYMRAVRLTCKRWNGLFKSRSFTKMHIGKEEAATRELRQTRMIVMMDYNVYLMGIAVNEIPSIETLDDDTKIVVWNPYLGQTRWIQTRLICCVNGWKKYALGYGNNSENRSCRSPKILRVTDNFNIFSENIPLQYEIYDFDSDVWTTLDVSPHWFIMSERGLSLKGNTYWDAKERHAYGSIDHIICFDFTRERFGPLLLLPFSAWGAQFASLSSVREDKITALFQNCRAYKLELWITTKIDVNNATWSKFFTMDTPYLHEILSLKTFFIDEENKIVVVSNKERDTKGDLTHDSIDIINGEARCLWKLGLGKPADKNCWPLVCPYVPSVVQIKQHKGGKTKEQSDYKRH